MSDLVEELSRPGLPARLRCLCTLTAAIGPANWPRLRACASAARSLGIPREDLAEGLLQATLFFGFPRAVTAFGVLHDAWPPDPDRTPGPGTAAEEERAAGTELFDAIYDSNAASVHEMLEGFHSAFHDFVIESAYGRILARPLLNRRDRELCAVAALATLEQIPQLTAHGRGALRFGASISQLQEVVQLALPETTDDSVARILRRITRRQHPRG